MARLEGEPMLPFGRRDAEEEARIRAKKGRGETLTKDEAAFLGEVSPARGRERE